MICVNKTNNAIIADNVKRAYSFTERLTGLLNKKSISENEGLLISPCRQIHTMFMKFPIDAVFLDKKNRVIEISSLKPFRISKWFLRAKSVLEISYKRASKHIKIGDVLEFKK